MATWQGGESEMDNITQHIYPIQRCKFIYFYIQNSLNTVFLNCLKLFFDITMSIFSCAEMFVTMISGSLVLHHNKMLPVSGQRWIELLLLDICI